MSQPKLYRRTTPSVEAMQWVPGQEQELMKFIGGEKGGYFRVESTVNKFTNQQTRKKILVLKSHRGIIEAYENDWIVRDQNGHLSPYEKTAFAKTFEEIK